jgi:hypothetical protein
LDLSEFAFGTASVGSRIGYDDFVRLADRAQQAGIFRFDSAPQYGRGLAQVFLQRYLKLRPDSKATVTSKLGRLPVADLKSIAIVLARREWKHAARLFGTARRHTADFSADNLLRSLEFTRASMDLGRVDSLFIHSSPQPLLNANVEGTMLKLCGDRFRAGIAEPCPEDLAWLSEHTPERWSIQVSAEALLANRTVQQFPGTVWVNSIIRYSRKKGLNLRETMDRLRAARERDRVFVIGFNHARLFDDLAAL